MTTDTKASTASATDAPTKAEYRLAGHTARRAEPSASNRGKRIGILIVAYNAVTTLTKVLERIPVDVWANVEEVVVFDDASKDATYELAVGYKAVSGLQKLRVIKN